MFWIIATGCVLLAVLMPIYWKRHPEIKTTPKGLRIFKAVAWGLSARCYLSRNNQTSIPLPTDFSNIKTVPLQA